MKLIDCSVRRAVIQGGQPDFYPLRLCQLQMLTGCAHTNLSNFRGLSGAFPPENLATRY